MAEHISIALQRTAAMLLRSVRGGHSDAPFTLHLAPRWRSLSLGVLPLGCQAISIGSRTCLTIIALVGTDPFRPTKHIGDSYFDQRRSLPRLQQESRSGPGGSA